MGMSQWNHVSKMLDKPELYIGGCRLRARAVVYSNACHGDGSRVRSGRRLRLIQAFRGDAAPQERCEPIDSRHSDREKRTYIVFARCSYGVITRYPVEHL